MIKLFKKEEEEPKDLNEAIKQIGFLNKKYKELSEEINKIKRENKFFIKQIGIVRYNPFSNSGGNQSFSIALLNEKKCGIVITSLYTRDSSRVYGKPIENGISSYSLSEEEKEAIKKALNEK